MPRFAVLSLFLMAVLIPGISVAKTSGAKTSGAKTSQSKAADVVILDVRTPQEFRDQAVEGAVNIDVTDSRFIARVNELDKTKTYKLYCRSGNRSSMAESLMKAEGFKHLENLGSTKEAAKKLGRKCLPKNC